MTPLAYSAVFIPLLPTHLMSLDEAYTLIHDCTHPLRTPRDPPTTHTSGTPPSHHPLLPPLLALRLLTQ